MYRVIDVMQEFIDRSTGQRSIMAELWADTAADLPPNTQDLVFIIGSFATAIDTGDTYKINSAGAWILQPNQNQFENVYTKSEIDAFLNPLTANQYLHNSTQVNLDAVTWTRSGGGLYYSSTVEIPNSPITKIYHATLSGFANLRATDMIIPAVRRSGGWSGFLLYANTNSFLSGAWVTVSVSGIA